MNNIVNDYNIITIKIDIKKYLLAKMNVNSKMENNKIVNNIKINGVYYSKINSLNCHVNYFFTNNCFDYLVLSILYKMAEKYKSLPDKLINMVVN